MRICPEQELGVFWPERLLELHKYFGVSTNLEAGDGRFLPNRKLRDKLDNVMLQDSKRECHDSIVGFDARSIRIDSNAIFIVNHPLDDSVKKHLIGLKERFSFASDNRT